MEPDYGPPPWWTEPLMKVIAFFTLICGVALTVEILWGRGVLLLAVVWGVGYMGAGVSVFLVFALKGANSRITELEYLSNKYEMERDAFKEELRVQNGLG